MSTPGNAPINSVSDVVAEQIIAARKRQTLTREELAAAAQAAGAPATFTGASVRNLETGRRGPDGARRRDVSIDELVFLSAALGVPPVELMGPHAELFGAELVTCRRCDAEAGPVELAVRSDIKELAELTGVERSHTEAALRLARAVDKGDSGGSKLPALTKELRQTLEVIMAGRRGAELPEEEDDDLDDLDAPE